MSVTVSFARLGGANSVNVQLITAVRAMETLAVHGTTTGAAQGREVAVIANSEASAILAAWGSAPDAAATAETASTTAGLPIGAGQREIVALNPGDKINVKAAG